MSAAPSPARDPMPPHDPEHVPKPDPIHFDQPNVAPVDPEPIPDHDQVSFGLPDIAPLIQDPVPAPIDLPLAEPFIPPPTSADVAPLPPVESDIHRTDLPIIFLQDIPAPHPGEGTSSQHPRYDPFASAAFPLIPQTSPFAPFTYTSLDEPFRWFPPYSIPISDPYHPSHFVGYTRDELLLSLQLQFEVLGRRVLELELTPRPPPCPCQSTFVPPHLSSSPFAHPPAPSHFPGVDARSLTIEQQISFLLRRVYEREEELAHVRSLLFSPPPPPPSAQ
ncbi:proline-rich receptor-like protein kinase PERK2 [Helianthus annuus]|uniref:proline-rich receptor-like protein kinase PERK2 n=1 Tax=Helianthus annuus TaxID=4232 RepID=UPI000B8F63B0|nr:proline-rich receptor-like protein kinase PERK2 [Helianthus annuus]